MKKLFKLAAIVGIAFGINKMAATKKEWSGLTEAEARARLDGKLASKVPDASKRAEIGDKVVDGLRKRGMLREADSDRSDGSVEAAAAGEATSG